MISVVVPTRNRPQLAMAALAGIKAQTCLDYEVILVDDGSDEQTRSAYAEMWSQFDTRFRLLLLGQSGQPGFGASVVRNHGISHSRGELITFCDDDDIWVDPEHLARVTAAFSELAELDIYLGNQRAVDVSGHCQEDWLPALCARVSQRSKRFDGSVIVNIEDLCKAGGFGHMNTLSLRRALVNNIQGFWHRASYEEDRDFFWRAVGEARLIAFNPQVIAQHHIPDRRLQMNLSTMHSQSERAMMALMVCQHIIASVKHPAVVQLMGVYSGDLLRKMALLLKEKGQLAAASHYARQALGARFSFKWAAFTLLLAGRSWLSRHSA